MICKKGATRTVFLAGKYAFKFPSLYSWKLFLYGLLGNMQEANFSQMGWEKLCPVVFSLKGGFLVVMKRADPIAENDFLNLDYKGFIDSGVPVENKNCSFGRLNGKIVAVDYGG